MANIFCVEDDTGIRELITCALQSGGYTAKGFPDGKSFFQRVQEEQPALILLDIMLPDEDGISILKRLKSDAATAEIPVIMLSAKSSEIDKVTGLENGADDYITKPFGMMEFISRVKAVLRRGGTRTEETLVHGPIQIRIQRHEVLVHGQKVELTLKEFELLKYLVENRGIVLTRDQLLTRIWGYDFDGETRTVDVHVRTLRQKLGEAGTCIETVRGVGYRMGDES